MASSVRKPRVLVFGGARFTDVDYLNDFKKDHEVVVSSNKGR